MTYSSKWTQFAKTPEEKEKALLLVKNSRALLDLLTQIVTKELEENQQGKEEDFDKPSWPYFAAFKQGKVRALTNILTLTKVTK